MKFRGHIPALDGLRGTAIIAVFLYHYARGAGAHTSSSFVKAAASLFGLGWSGVDLFFVLSGFLITGILCDTLSDSGYYKKFYARRMLRIFPIYYLTVLVFLVLTPLLSLHWMPGHLSFLVYLGYPAALIWPSLVQISPYVAITHLWSLSVEEQFYMIWPLLVARLRKPETIVRVCVILAAVALLFRAVIYSSSRVEHTWAYAFLLARMDCIAIGAAIAALVRSRWQPRLNILAPYVFALATCVVVAICVWRRTTEHEDPVMATVGFSALALMFGSVLTLGLSGGSWAAQVFSLPVLRMFGKYSYGLYLYHFPLTVVLGPLKPIFVGRAHSYVVGSTLHLVFNLVVNLLVAAASFHFFEQPILRFKDRFSYGASEPARARAGQPLVATPAVVRRASAPLPEQD